MLTEVIPIVVFVNRKVLLPAVKLLIEPLALDLSVIINLLVNHFHDMGIFFVQPKHEQMMLEQLIKQLRISPEIHKMAHQVAVQKARAKPKRG